MLKEYSLKLLQKAMNAALCLDEDMPTRLRALEGRCIEMVVHPLQVRFFISFKAGKVQLSEHGVADTVIQSTPLGLIRLSCLPASKARSLFNDQIRISGDLELGQQVKRIFDEMDIDWEGHLARFTGDVVAYQLGSFVRETKRVKARVTDSLCANVSEYLQEELLVTPSRQELTDFYSDVDALSLQVERLQARLKQLKTQ